MHQKFIISVGDAENFISKLKSSNRVAHMINSPDIVICSKVPQIEILKRASLFITHSGMNSTSEALLYAVPMICIPIDLDQPIVAHQVCNVLKLGVYFDPLKLDSGKIADSMRELLGDERYLTKSIEFSQIAQKYDGVKETTKLILDYLYDYS